MQEESPLLGNTRRTVLKQFAAAAVVNAIPLAGRDAPSADAGVPGAAQSEEVILEDSELRAAFDPVSGALTALEYKPTGWAIQKRPELGASFWMYVPLPDRRDNFILGHKQRAKRVKKSGNQVHLEWDNLVSERAGVLPISFTATVTLWNGKLTFESSLENHSALAVEVVGYPFLGDLGAPTPDTPMWRREMWYNNLNSSEIYPHFSNQLGYWGDKYPMQNTDSFADYTCSLFWLIQSSGQGVYVQVNDHQAKYMVRGAFEQKPGDLDSIYNRVPSESEISDHTVHLEFRANHFLYAGPDAAVNLTPIVMCGYRGDWQAGADLYKQWRATWFKQRPIPAWAKKVHSWQQLQANTPEESLRVPYRDLVKYAKQCAHYGVTAIQFVGWNRGGQDGGNPSLDTDPRLGTWRELHDAIAQCQAMGVNIVLFGKFPWADMTTAWYRRELYKYDVKDPFGIPYQKGGYCYDTPTQLAGISSHRFAVMCFRDPAYLQVAGREFAKVVALNAAGFLYDEVCWHGHHSCYCFATDHGHSVPGYVYNGDIPMAEILDKTTGNNPEFLFAGEAPEDILLQHYTLSYFRISAGHTPISRYIDSHVPLMVAVTGFDDREMLNRALMYRYIISYEPYNFKGKLGDFPLTMAYGDKIDALRRRYKHWLWDAEYRDTLGASVITHGGPQPHPIIYSVFQTSIGERAVVVVNDDFSKSAAVTVKLPHPHHLVVVTLEQPDPRPTAGLVHIPPRSAVVLLEQRA